LKIYKVALGETIIVEAATSKDAILLAKNGNGKVMSTTEKCAEIRDLGALATVSPGQLSIDATKEKPRGMITRKRGS
jgi:hypothetical protein